MAQSKEEREAVLAELEEMERLAELEETDEEPDFPLSMLCFMEQFDKMLAASHKKEPQAPITYPKVLQDL